MTDDQNSTRHRGAPPSWQAGLEPSQPVTGRDSDDVPDDAPDGVLDDANDPGATRYRRLREAPTSASGEQSADSQPDVRTRLGATRSARGRSRTRPATAPQAESAAIPQGIEAADLPARHLDVPVYRPRRHQPGGPRRLLAAASGVVLVVLGAGVGYLLHKPPAAQPKSQAPVAVTQISARALSGDLHCPSAVLQAEATLTVTGGTAQVRYVWLLPTGGSSAPHSVGVSPGAATTVTLNYTLSGRGDANGVVALHITDPVDVYSNPVPVKYSCP